VEDLAPLVSGVLAPSGEAIPDPSSGRLILRGDAASVERALEVLASLDTPIRSYRVESILSTLRDLDRMGVELGGWLESGGVRIGRASGPEGVAVRLDALRSSEDRHFRGLVTVIDGRAAELWTGTEEPRRSRHIEREGGRVRIHETTTLVPVRTGFRVVPRGLPDGRVELELVSVAARSDLDGDIAQTGTATRVAVAPGELIVVGTIGREDRQTSTNRFSGVARQEESTETVLLLRVDPLTHPAAPDSGTISPPGGFFRSP
jgi:type II secretory pathway component GspD/PulD (secretin)